MHQIYIIIMMSRLIQTSKKKLKLLEIHFLIVYKQRFHFIYFFKII